MKNSWVSTSFPHSTSHSLLSVKFCQVKEEKRTLPNWNQTKYQRKNILGRLAQLVTCLATDASLTADPGVVSSIPAQSILSWRLIMK